MLLSDRHIHEAIAAGRLGISPYEPDTMLQPASIDVRLDDEFLVFENHRYGFIDPALEQEDLTRRVRTAGGEAFVLHPGEFVLASTFEEVRMGDDLAARLEGKALSIATPIPTPGGWVSMGDLKVDDTVFDENGQPCRVLAATDVMVGRPCREVVFSGGESIVADLSHQWITRDKNDRRFSRPVQVRTTAEIEATLRVPWNRELNHHVPLADAVQYPEQELLIDPYTLGVWLGDGTSTKAEVTVGAGDEQTLEEIKKAGYEVWHASSPRSFRIGGLRRGQVGRSRSASGTFCADGSLSSLLRALGVLGNKHVPDEYLRGSCEQRLALLQGLMDSDGYANEKGGVEFCNTKEPIADAVFELAASLGLRPSKWKKQSVTLNGVDHGPAWLVKFTPHLPVFRLARKLARLRDPGGRFRRYRAITDVRPIESLPVRCIQVSSPSGVFLASRSFIPTHNSSLGRLGLVTHSTAGFIDPGFHGHITLELSNSATLPLLLWPGMKVGQLCLIEMSGPAEHPYGSAVRGSRYQGQRGPTASRSWKNFHRTVLPR